MAVEIRLYSFAKRLNSTKTPDNNETFYSYDCNFLDSESIMNPVVIIEAASESAGLLAHNFTYAYIPNLSRYYFVSNIVVNSTSLCTIYLQVDVLGSFKTGFLPTTQYVLRSTNRYNDDLIDNIYPIVPMPNASCFSATLYQQNSVYAYNNKTGVWGDANLFNVTYADGAILFGVTGQGGVSCDHYIAHVGDFQTFINNVVTATPTSSSMWGNLPTGVQAALSNFIQYITYVRWIPFYPLTDNLGSSVSTLYLGEQAFSLSCRKVKAGLNKQQLRFMLQVPHHPLYSTHKYYNLSPFREVNLFYPLIGNIPLDTTKLYDEFASNSVYVQVILIVDLATGDTEYTVVKAPSYVGPNDFTTNMIANGMTNISVSLSLTDYSMSVEAAIASGMTYIASNALNEYLASKTESVKDIGGTHTSSSGSTHSGHGGTIPESNNVPTLLRVMNKVNNIKENLNAKSISTSIYDVIGNKIDLAPIADVLGSFSSFVSSGFGQVSTSGHTGSFLMSVCTMPVVYCWFKKHADEDYSRFGRPYSNTSTLSLISGFCVCRGANYSGEGTVHPLKPELEAINKLLNTGIYIET